MVGIVKTGGAMVDIDYSPISHKYITVFAENVIGMRFLVVYFLYKPIPTHEKLFAVGKSGPNATLNPFFLVVGLALGWGVRRFHYNIYMFSNST